MKSGRLNTGVVYRSGVRLNSSREFNLVYSVDESLEGVLGEEADYYVPERVQAGLAYQSTRWMIALDGGWERWSRLNLSPDSKIRYDDVFSLSAGAEYALLANPYDSPLQAVRLRMGAGLKNSYVVLNEDNFLVWQFSAGLGLPISQLRNILHLTYKYTHQGRDFGALWVETSHSLSIGVDLRDIWFVKRKIR